MPLTVSSAGANFNRTKPVMQSEIMLMTSTTRQDRAELMDSILQVAMACPADQSTPADCPLFAVRKMSLPRRINWLHSLTDDDLAYLASYHCVCMKTRLEAFQPGLCAC